jgi:hypothetical protein
VAFQDLATNHPAGVLPTPLADPDGGWAELMELAASFPLEMLSFGGSRTNVDSLPVVLPKPRAVSYDDVITLVDGVGLSLATW